MVVSLRRLCGHLIPSQGTNYMTTNDDSEMEGEEGLQLNVMGRAKADLINTLTVLRILLIFREINNASF